MHIAEHRRLLQREASKTADDANPTQLPRQTQRAGRTAIADKLATAIDARAAEVGARNCPARCSGHDLMGSKIASHTQSS